MRVYVETGVWGVIPKGQNPAMRQPTLRFLKQCEKKVFEACVSEVVIDEINRAPQATRDAILRRLALVLPTVLPFNEECDDLAKRFIDEEVVPRRRVDDARHVACAFIHDVRVVVSWNYRHLANVRKSERFNAVAARPWDLEIHTPLEMLG